MAKLGTVAAAKLAAVHRSTIHRYCERGRLSFEVGPDGDRLIDTVELARVFDLVTSDGRTPSPHPTPPPSQQPPETVAPVAALHERIDQLVVELRRRDDEIARLRAELDDERRDRRLMQERVWELSNRYTQLLTGPGLSGSSWGVAATVSDVASTVRTGLKSWVERQVAKGRH